ncbi:unnamed protein product [Amoebophrya sp. A120]|nr:unnamed protein product [Amoebophrya sp. A120]|eukprot:GSA120T00008070001.1
MNATSSNTTATRTPESRLRSMLKKKNDQLEQRKKENAVCKSLRRDVRAMLREYVSELQEDYMDEHLRPGESSNENINASSCSSDTASEAADPECNEAVDADFDKKYQAGNELLKHCLQQLSQMKTSSTSAKTSDAAALAPDSNKGNGTTTNASAAAVLGSKAANKPAPAKDASLAAGGAAATSSHLGVNVNGGAAPPINSAGGASRQVSSSSSMRGTATAITQQDLSTGEHHPLSASTSSTRGLLTQVHLGGLGTTTGGATLFNTTGCSATAASPGLFLQHSSGGGLHSLLSSSTAQSPLTKSSLKGQSFVAPNLGAAATSLLGTPSSLHQTRPGGASGGSSTSSAAWRPPLLMTSPMHRVQSPGISVQHQPGAGTSGHLVTTPTSTSSRSLFSSAGGGSASTIAGGQQGSANPNSPFFFRNKPVAIGGFGLPANTVGTPNSTTTTPNLNLLGVGAGGTPSGPGK